uniref:Uncharacterized protein n=1 Tax=Opuntia streptacantha TaxID=393608 RepID=A0A7C9EB20_OPUST
MCYWDRNVDYIAINQCKLFEASDCSQLMDRHCIDVVLLLRGRRDTTDWALSGGMERRCWAWECSSGKLMSLYRLRRGTLGMQQWMSAVAYPKIKSRARGN